MTQRHGMQIGTFHITTNSKAKIPWCTHWGIPELLIDNLLMTKNLHCAKIFGFCILPDHLHLLLEPGESGLSMFMHSFKRNTMRDIRSLYRSGRSPSSATECDAIAWQKSFYEERIRDSAQRSHALSYIRTNPVHHDLCASIEDWPWLSDHFPRLLDPMEIWFS
ncbi:hypothetical protein A3D88_00215 [Candidatus Peribacteria bacterium RIFCSPHIGHO2_02_FULL_52_16]|nr:MAG: hypothetical protein A2706_01195 [Candidatus Peribacteria bacterium RIFCSPHIGHO2_01_FULL_51_35]OGJ61547.1 MAG: hypothetical protein A3D88_00215 [Candidatus Peribacteria bacterium RIFCSPHIGHO2_02_FULL_52_16]